MKEGEYKSWYENGQLYNHCFYKNDELEENIKGGTRTDNYLFIVFQKQ